MAWPASALPYTGLAAHARTREAFARSEKSGPIHGGGPGSSGMIVADSIGKGTCYSYAPGAIMQDSSTTCHHVVYWTIPLIDAQGSIVNEQHYAVDLSEIDPEDARRIEAMLDGNAEVQTGEGEPIGRRTDPAITEYRHLFRPFIEVKRRAHDLCRFSAVWLPFEYAEYADRQDEPRHHTHPSVRPLAGAG